MIKTKVVSTGGEFAVKAGGKNPLLLMSGPCVIESREKCFKLAEKLKKFAKKNNVSYIFKASFDKANRSSVDAFRGPGILDGLEILGEIRNTFGMPVVTDIHEPWQAELAAKYVDVLQIPAFLCRQTDLLIAAGETGCVVNVKKMQCLA